jgi:hypothetical protein
VLFSNFAFANANSFLETNDVAIGKRFGVQVFNFSKAYFGMCFFGLRPDKLQAISEIVN